MKPPFTKEQLIDYIAQRGYTADTETWWEWYVKTEFCYALGKIKCKLVNWKADVNMKLRHGSFGARKKGEEPVTPPVKKLRLFPIIGKNCTCGMPAVYKVSGNYDHYYCVNCMPAKVREKYE